jgi:hypothetical protein
VTSFEYLRQLVEYRHEALHAEIWTLLSEYDKRGAAIERVRELLDSAEDGDRALFHADEIRRALDGPS